MNGMLVLPVAIPLATAAVAVMLQKSRIVQRLFGIVGTVLMVIASLLLFDQVVRDGIQVLQLGDWAAPFGITLVADRFSIIMVVITAIMGLAVAIYSLANVDEEREAFGYYPLLFLLLMGVNGTFLTGDMFNMYVWFEVMLISSFVLLALGNRPDQMEGAVKYVTINLISSMVFLAGVGLLYGMTGTLNMADLHVRLNELNSPGLVTAVSMLFLVSFGIKAAVFPLFFWLPASYHTPPVAVSAIFAGLLTKVGVYALIRVYTLLFTQDTGYTHTIILWISGLTMLTGVLGAAAQYEFRKILSFHIISQIGYMIMGLGLFTPLGLVGSVFYIVHHIIVKTNLFLVAGVANRIVGSFELKNLGGLYKYYPFLGALFLIPAFSLAGFPPLSGFWAKLTLTIAALQIESWVIVGVALLVGLLTLFSMTKIWAEAFWKPLTTDRRPVPSTEVESREGLGGRTGLILLFVPVILLATMTLIIGIFPHSFYELSLETANELLDPSRYVEAVLRP